MDGKHFSLFNAARWADAATGNKDWWPLLSTVPVLYEGPFMASREDMLRDGVSPVHEVLADLGIGGSKAAPGYMKPEGIVIWHTAARTMFKVTLEGDEKPKGSKE